VWATDFKGWFYTQDKERCDPLTVTDLFSRQLIGLQALPQATQMWTRMAYKQYFRTCGLPEIIRMDNGSPFGSIGPGGLSKLTVWWISLGIDVEFIKPASPYQNGSHERMHRTLKDECCTPPSANRQAQQKRFDRWRKEFNEERPHEAIGQRAPAVWSAGGNASGERGRERVLDGAGLACGRCLRRTSCGVRATRGGMRGRGSLCEFGAGRDRRRVSLWTHPSDGV